MPPKRSKKPSESLEPIRPVRRRGRPRRAAPQEQEAPAPATPSESSGPDSDDSEYVPKRKTKKQVVEEEDEESGVVPEASEVPEEPEEDPNIPGPSTRARRIRIPVPVPEPEPEPEQEEDPNIPGPSTRRATTRHRPPAPTVKKTLHHLVKLVVDPLRPVVYRMAPPELKKYDPNEVVRRVRVTRNVFRNLIPHYWNENSEDTILENVEIRSMGETVRELIEGMSLNIAVSENFKDIVTPIATEYDGSTKMFSFGAYCKKHSCKQKRMKFQTSWNRKKEEKPPFKKPRCKFFGEPVEPRMDHLGDPNLFEQHFMTSVYWSHLQVIIKKIRMRLNKRRTDDDIIRDSSYFVREFYLPKGSFNLHITRCVDIPPCFVPPIMEAGYFPLSARNKSDKKHYLASRYQEAQLEYLSLTLRSIEPHEGFKIGSIKASELLKFHEIGHHIHGFYQVWEVEKDEWFEDYDGDMKKRRYLVDIFNFLKFPLYMEWERWDNRIKSSFDANSIYLLHLTEVLRVNFPILFRINPAGLHNPVTLEEMCKTMAIQYGSMNSVALTEGVDEFYRVADRTVTDNSLSAYFLITGGSKTMVPKDSDESSEWKVWRTDSEDVLRRNLENGELEEATFEAPIQKIVYWDPEDSIKVTKIVQNSDPLITRIIADVPKKTIEKPKAPEAVVISRRPKVSRMAQIHWRRRREQLEPMKKYIFPGTEPPIKKKPGRKPADPMKKLLERHGFYEGGIVEKDFDSDLEGFSYTEDDMPQIRPPKLRRSTSSESILLKSTYLDHSTDRLSWYYKRSFQRASQSFKERKSRRLGELAQNRLVQAKILTSTNRTSSEMFDCFHRKLPRLALEVKNTKIAVRHNAYKHYNLPKVFIRGDQPIIDDCAEALRSMVNVLVAKDTVNTRMQNILTQQLQNAMKCQKVEIQKLGSQKSSSPLISKFWMIESLTHAKLPDFEAFKTAKSKLKTKVSELGNGKKMKKLEVVEPLVYRVTYKDPVHVELNRTFLNSLKIVVKGVKKAVETRKEPQMPRLRELLAQEPGGQKPRTRKSRFRGPEVEKPRIQKTRGRKPRVQEPEAEDPRIQNQLEVRKAIIQKPEAAEPIFEQLVVQEPITGLLQEAVQIEPRHREEAKLLEQRILEQEAQESRNQGRPGMTQEPRALEQEAAQPIFEQLVVQEPVHQQPISSPRNPFSIAGILGNAVQNEPRGQEEAELLEQMILEKEILERESQEPRNLRGLESRRSFFGNLDDGLGGSEVPRNSDVRERPDTAPASVNPVEPVDPVNPEPEPTSEEPASSSTSPAAVPPASRLGQASASSLNQGPPTSPLIQASPSASVPELPINPVEPVQSTSEEPTSSSTTAAPVEQAPVEPQPAGQASSSAEPVEGMGAVNPVVPVVEQVEPAPARGQDDAQADGQAESQAGSQADGQADGQADVQADVQADSQADGQADGQADVQADGQAEGQAGSQADGQADGRADGRADSQADGQADVQADGQAGSQAGSQADGQADGRADGRADSQADGQADVQAEGQAGSQAGSQADGQADGRADSQADGQADGQADSQADGQADGQADVQADGQADGQAESQAGSQADGQADGQADSQADGQADGQADSQADGQADGQADVQADGQAEGQAGSQADGQADGQADSQADGQADGQAEGQASVPPALPAPPPSHWIPATPPDLLNCFWTSISSIEDPNEPAGRKMVSELVIPVLLAEQSKREHRKENLDVSVMILMMIGYLHCKKTPSTKRGYFVKLDGIAEAEEVKRMIIEASTWIQLAGKEKMVSEFRSYVNWNGFPRIGDQFKKIKDKILELVKVKNVRDQGAGRSDEEIFLEVVAVLKVFLEKEMSDAYGWISPSEGVIVDEWKRGNQEFVEKMESGEIEDLAVEESGLGIMLTWFRKLNG